MTGGVVITRPGWRTLLQDAGRVGYYRQGLTLSGPLDLISFLWANRLCGNAANSTALEISYGHLTLRAESPVTVSVTGADTPLEINGNAAGAWRSFTLRPGDQLALGSPRHGLVNYLAVSGGFDVPRQFGSTATCVREVVGGISGESIKTGDRLATDPQQATRGFSLPKDRHPTLNDSSPLRVVPGWHYFEFAPEARRQFFTDQYRISSKSNRMGYRLEGSPVPWRENQPMLSEGLVPGTIQVPPDGQPIIMHRDHQTIGGYPKIGTLATVDLWRLAHMVPGTPVRFTPVTRQRAQRLYRDAIRQFEKTIPVVTGS